MNDPSITLCKSNLDAIACNGFEYAGFWDGMYHYQRKSPTGYQFEQVSLFQSDVVSGNAEWMMNNCYTRVIEK